jgi:hypothetical protein
MEANLCYGFPKSDWPHLRQRLDDGDENAWPEAISVFERRIRERFFSSIDALVAADSKPDIAFPTQGQSPCVPGFSIVALCCLLIDTLQGFRTRPTSVAPTGPCAFPNGPCVKQPVGTNEQFKLFLGRPAFGGAFTDAAAQAFVRGVRNGILHEARTRKWVIWRNEPAASIVAVEQNGYALNRTLFYDAIRKEFESYVGELRGHSNMDLRERFKKKWTTSTGKHEDP